MGQALGHPADLGRTGKEDQDVAVAGVEGAFDHVRDVGEESRVDAHPVGGVEALSRWGPVHLDGVAHRFGADGGRGFALGAEECGPESDVGGGGGGDEAEVGAQDLAGLGEEGAGGVGLEVALMAFVEHDEVDAGEFGVGDEPVEQDPGGHDLDAGGGGPARFAPDLVADPLTGLLAEDRGHPRRGGPGGEPARFGHEDSPLWHITCHMFAAWPEASPAGMRPARASGASVVLPVPGRRGEHGGPGTRDGVEERGKRFADRQLGQRGRLRHADHSRRARAAAASGGRECAQAT